MSSDLSRTKRAPLNTAEERRVTARRSAIALVSSVVLTAVLFFVPALELVAYPLLLLSTFVHEMGHGIAAILVGGNFQRFEFFSDGSGVATLALPPTRFASAFASFGGLVGPAILGGILFAVGTSRRLAEPTLWALSAMCVLSVALFVRNAFGIFYILALAGILFGIARAGGPLLKQFTVIFIGAQLCLSVFSRGDYLFTPYAETELGRMPSDVQQIASALLLPYWFWGALIGLFSAAVVGFGIWLSVRSVIAHAGDLPDATPKKRLPN